MTDLREELERLEMTQYLEAFVADGFHSWESILDIRESDLNTLNVKLGHRRKLQRAIAESRGRAHKYHPPIALSKDTSVHGSHQNDDYPLDDEGNRRTTSAYLTAGGSAKRKYRRRPKPDKNAPERPPTAYVMFSVDVRRSLKSHALTFAETARVIGRQWQNLPAKVKEFYEHEASIRKKKYYAKMAEYRISPEYNAYQNYLREFKRKYTALGKEDIHYQSETQTSICTQSSSAEYCSQSSDSITTSDNSTSLDSFATGRYQGKQSYPPKPVSRLTRCSTGDSPHGTDPSSPPSASSWSAALHQKEVPSFPINKSTEIPKALQPAQGFQPAFSPLNQIAHFSPLMQPPVEPRPPSSFTALLRAGELARNAHEAMDDI